MLRKIVRHRLLLPRFWPAGARRRRRTTALQMVAIDVEGGGGTLFVTPEGKSLLIDTGNPEQSRATGDNPSSARIAAAAQALGVKKIDYLLITHYHGDHIGGFEGLLARIPIGTVIDHGHNRETTASPNPTAPQIDMNNPPPGSTAYGYQQYIEADREHHLHHIVAKPGEVFHIGSMTVTIVMADAQADRQADAGRGRGQSLLRRHGRHGRQWRGGKCPLHRLGDQLWQGADRRLRRPDLGPREGPVLPGRQGRQGGCLSGHPSRHRLVGQPGGAERAGAGRGHHGQLRAQGRRCRRA